MTRSRLQAQRRKVVMGVAAVLLLAVGAFTAGVVFGPSMRSPQQAAADAAPPAASVVTAVAEERVVAEPVMARGTIAPGEAVKLTAPAGLSGAAAVVTAVPAKAGAQLNEGAVVVEVAGQPVFGLVLPFPLYRDIEPDAKGPDVREVQNALRRLGHKAPANGTYDQATQDALKAFYAARGYTAPNALPRDHVVKLDKAGRKVSALPAGVGTTLNGAESVLAELDVGASHVQVLVSHEQLAIVTQGSTAEVVDEVRGERVQAKVAQIAEEPTQGEQGNGYRVRLTFTGQALTPAKDHTVLVTIGAQEDTKPVLAVPVTAVYSRPDGSTFVTAVPGGDVTVRTGRTAGGWVEVASDQLKAGTEVAVGVSDRTKAKP